MHKNVDEDGQWARFEQWERAEAAAAPPPLWQQQQERVQAELAARQVQPAATLPTLSPTPKFDAELRRWCARVPDPVIQAKLDAFDRTFEGKRIKKRLEVLERERLGQPDPFAERVAGSRLVGYGLWLLPYLFVAVLLWCVLRV